MPGQSLDPKIFYKRDMEVKVNGYQAEGVLAVPYAEKYKFDIDAKGKLDLFTFTTCHREQTREQAGGKSWFSNKKSRKFEYNPAPIEAGPLACPAHLGGYEIGKGRHSWAFVDFGNPDLKLPAYLSCNGSQGNFTGVSVCQSKAGLLQRIEFTEPVLYPEKPCAKLKTNDDMRFEFAMPKGECVIRFVTKTGDEMWHRITLLGYEQILLRGD